MKLLLPQVTTGSEKLETEGLKVGCDSKCGVCGKCPLCKNREL